MTPAQDKTIIDWIAAPVNIKKNSTLGTVLESHAMRARLQDVSQINSIPYLFWSMRVRESSIVWRIVRLLSREGLRVESQYESSSSAIGCLGGAVSNGSRGRKIPE
jgi:hypothetical protein